MWFLAFVLPRLWEFSLDLSGLTDNAASIFNSLKRLVLGSLAH